MPAALGNVRETLRADLPADERRWLALDADAVLGLDLHRVWAEDATTARPAVPAEVAALVEARSVARSSQDFARADELRAEIEGLGWDVADGPGGSTVSRAG